MRMNENNLHIFLCRHGESYANQQQIIGGDTPLTERGKQHAKILSYFFRGKNLKTIYTSTKKRCIQTAAIIAQFHPRTPIKALDQLAEVYHGPFLEGMTYQEFETQMPEAFQRRNKNKYHWKSPGGESYHEAAQRMQPIFEEVLKKDGSYIIVSHGGTMRIFLHTFCSYPKEVAHQAIAHLSVFEIQISRGKHPESVKEYNLKNE